MNGELKQQMWKNMVHFVEQIVDESVTDISWKYNDDGAVEKIIISFEHPLYITEANED